MFRTDGEQTNWIATLRPSYVISSSLTSLIPFYFSPGVMTETGRGKTIAIAATTSLRFSLTDYARMGQSGFAIHVGA